MKISLFNLQYNKKQQNTKMYIKRNTDKLPQPVMITLKVFKHTQTCAKTIFKTKLKF